MFIFLSFSNVSIENVVVNTLITNMQHILFVYKPEKAKQNKDPYFEGIVFY